MQHVTDMVVEFLLLGLAPTVESKAMWKHGVMVFGLAQMRGDGEGAVQARTLDIFGISLDWELAGD